MRTAAAISLLVIVVTACGQHSKKPKMTHEAFRAFSKKAYEYLNTQQERAKSEFNLGAYERYDWDQESRRLIWSDNGVAKVIADIQFVGSISLRSDTWLWSWANPTIIKSMSEEMADVRHYGEMHGIQPLIEAKWPADEVDGWEMTAIAAYILQSKGAYRSPDTNGFTFMVFSNIRFAHDAR
jgi:hypothetical protein